MSIHCEIHALISLMELFLISSCSKAFCRQTQPVIAATQHVSQMKPYSLCSVLVQREPIGRRCLGPMMGRIIHVEDEGRDWKGWSHKGQWLNGSKLLQTKQKRIRKAWRRNIQSSNPCRPAQLKRGAGLRENQASGLNKLWEGLWQTLTREKAVMWYHDNPDETKNPLTPQLQSSSPPWTNW